MSSERRRRRMVFHGVRVILRRRTKLGLQSAAANLLQHLGPLAERLKTRHPSSRREYVMKNAEIRMLQMQGECSRWLLSAQKLSQDDTNWANVRRSCSSEHVCHFRTLPSAWTIRTVEEFSKQLKLTVKQKQTTTTLKFDQNFTGIEELFCVSWFAVEKVKVLKTPRPDWREALLLKWSRLFSLFSCVFYKLDLCCFFDLSNVTWMPIGFKSVCVKTVWKRQLKVQFEVLWSNKAAFYSVVFEM